MKQPSIGQTLAAQNQGVIPTGTRYRKGHPTLTSIDVRPAIPAKAMAAGSGQLDAYIKALNRGQ